MPMILPSGSDDDGAKAVMPHLVRDGLEGKAEIGTVRVKGNDLVLNLNGEGSTGGDGVLDRDPAVAVVVAVEQ